MTAQKVVENLMYGGSTISLLLRRQAKYRNIMGNKTRRNISQSVINPSSTSKVSKQAVGLKRVRLFVLRMNQHSAPAYDTNP